MMVLRSLRMKLIAVALLLVPLVYGLVSYLRAANEKLEQKVIHYEIKEEADEVRSRPVDRDKSSILDRM